MRTPTSLIFILKETSVDGWQLDFQRTNSWYIIDLFLSIALQPSFNVLEKVSLLDRHFVPLVLKKFK